jgi:multisubunit Na+/H+ antiporter MnhB subunit
MASSTEVLISPKQLAVVALVLGAIVTILLNIYEIWRAHREGRAGRRSFGVAFYVMAALLLLGLLVTGNGDMLLNRTSNLR